MIVDILKKSRITLCRLLEAALILAVLILVLDVLWGVFTRWSGNFVVWLSGRGIEAWAFMPRGQNELTEEIARFLLIWISLLGAAVAFGEKAHLGVDYFVGKFDLGAQKFISVLGQAVVLFFAVSIFIIGGSSIVFDNLNQITPALGPEIGLKMGHVYLALPIAGVFIVIFTAERILELMLTKDDGGVN
jgi:TRAP-type C4-dicarboxylate transport system permease small subunit